MLARACNEGRQGLQSWERHVRVKWATPCCLLWCHLLPPVLFPLVSFLATVRDQMERMRQCQEECRAGELQAQQALDVRQQELLRVQQGAEMHRARETSKDNEVRNSGKLTGPWVWSLWRLLLLVRLGAPFLESALWNGASDPLLVTV